jgi:hypothetical protein
MIADDCSTTQIGMARLGRLVCQTQAKVRQMHAMFNRVSYTLDAIEGAGEDAESGWRRWQS